MLDSRMAAAFEDVDKTDQVGVHIGMGIDQRIAHPGLSSKVDHRVKMLGGEKSGCLLPVGHIEFRVHEFLMGLQPGKPVPLEPGVVIVVQVVESHNRPPLGQQAAGKGVADETGRPGDQHLV